MKKFILVLLVLLSFLLVGTSYAQTIIMVWDANTESDLAGYRLYQSNESGVYTYCESEVVATIPAGTQTLTLNNVQDGEWFWVLTAFDERMNESGPSNEVTQIVDNTSPGPPVMLMFFQLP